MTDQKTKNAEAFETVIRVAMHGKEKRKKFGIIEGGTYALPRVEPASGEWVFVADCPECGKASPLFRDESRGKFPRPFHGSGLVEAACHHCAKMILAKPDDLYSMQWSIAH